MMQPAIFGDRHNWIARIDRRLAELEKELMNAASRHWLSVAGVGLLALILALWGLPKWQVSHLAAEAVNPVDLANLENSDRVALAQIIGGAILLAGLFCTAWQISIARRGQITERFTRATDQLGSDKLQIRVGAIFAFEAIARDSEYFRWPVIEILAAFVRQQAPITTPISDSGSKVREVPADVQAAISVIGHTVRIDDVEYYRNVDLRGCELSGANLRNLCFRGALMEGSLLHGAFLEEINLREADLTGTTLSMANFSGANLSFALIQDVKADGADFSGASLLRAECTDVDFREADFSDADFTNTSLYDCHFEGADLRTSLGGPVPFGRVYFDSRTRRPTWNCMNSSTGEVVVGV